MLFHKAIALCCSQREFNALAKCDAEVASTRVQKLYDLRFGQLKTLSLRLCGILEKDMHATTWCPPCQYFTQLMSLLASQRLHHPSVKVSRHCEPASSHSSVSTVSWIHPDDLAHPSSLKGDNECPLEEQPQQMCQHTVTILFNNHAFQGMGIVLAWSLCSLLTRLKLKSTRPALACPGLSPSHRRCAYGSAAVRRLPPGSIAASNTRCTCTREAPRGTR